MQLATMESRFISQTRVDVNGSKYSLAMKVRRNSHALSWDGMSREQTVTRAAPNASAR